MLLIRRLHAYLGLFIAPSLLFFAFSGALQLFSLHEAHGDYRPPALIEALGNLHKDQVLSRPKRDHAPPPGAADHARRPDVEGHDHRTRLSTLSLKWFFEAVAVCLGVSTAFGLWIGLRFSPTPRLSWSLLIAGVLLPLVLALL